MLLVSLRHCRIGPSKPNVVNRCTMMSPIVVCYVAPIVRPALTKSYNPALLSTVPQRTSQQQKETLFPNLFFPYSTHDFVVRVFVFNWWQPTATQHWLDYVTKSEVDITAITHWLDCVSQVPPFAQGKLWLSLDRGRHHRAFLL